MKMSHLCLARHEPPLTIGRSSPLKLSGPLSKRDIDSERARVTSDGVGDFKKIGDKRTVVRIREVRIKVLKALFMLERLRISSRKLQAAASPLYVDGFSHKKD